MNNGIIYQGQSLLDKTLEMTGDVEQSFATALLNGVSITESFAIGTAVLLPEIKRKSIVGMFNAKNRPATEFLNDSYDFNKSLGIGTMAISTNFIVG